MKASIKFENKLIMVSEMINDSTFQVLEFEKLKGAWDSDMAAALESINNTGTKLKQVRIILDNSEVKLEPGAVSYMKGLVERKNNSLVNALNKGKKLISNKFLNDSFNEKPIYEGSGEIFLEPSFSYFVLVELEDEGIIVQDGLFLACENSIKVKSINNDRKSELELVGSGIVVLELPVPSEEVFRCKLYNDELKVDGDFVVLRGSNVDYSYETSSVVSGNGLINIYRGIGDVWLLPTKSIYTDIKNSKDYIEYEDDDDF